MPTSRRLIWDLTTRAPDGYSRAPVQQSQMDNPVHQYIEKMEMTVSLPELPIELGNLRNNQKPTETYSIPFGQTTENLMFGLGSWMLVSIPSKLFMISILIVIVIITVSVIVIMVIIVVLKTIQATAKIPKSNI